MCSTSGLGTFLGCPARQHNFFHRLIVVYQKLIHLPLKLCGYSQGPMIVLFNLFFQW